MDSGRQTTDRGIDDGHERQAAGWTVDDMPLFATAQTGQFAPVRLAFAWVQSNEVPLVLGQTNFLSAHRFASLHSLHVRLPRVPWLSGGFPSSQVKGLSRCGDQQIAQRT
jgi:hypothetical protein